LLLVVLAPLLVTVETQQPAKTGAGAQAIPATSKKAPTAAADSA